MADLSPSQLHILQHSLGLDQYGQGSWYRNYYVCGPGHHGFDDCRSLVAAGLMVEHPPRELFGGDVCFVTTEAGKLVVREQSAKPPKLTRAQRRYRAWIKADCGLSFGEWIKVPRREDSND